MRPLGRLPFLICLVPPCLAGNRSSRPAYYEVSPPGSEPCERRSLLNAPSATQLVVMPLNSSSLSCIPLLHWSLPKTRGRYARDTSLEKYSDWAADPASCPPARFSTYPIFGCRSHSESTLVYSLSYDWDTSLPRGTSPLHSIIPVMASLMKPGKSSQERFFGRDTAISGYLHLVVLAPTSIPDFYI